MSTVLTVESAGARRAFSMVSLQKCHAQSRVAPSSTSLDDAFPLSRLSRSLSPTSLLLPFCHRRPRDADDSILRRQMPLINRN